MKREKINNTHSNLAIKIVAGGIFLVFGFITLKMYVGIVFLMVSIIAFTYTTGIEIDYDKHEIREYTKYLWIINGRWKKLINYRGMTVKKTSKGIKQYAMGSASTSRYYIYYDVILMSDNYHKSINLFTSRDKDVSQSFARRWSEKLNIPLRVKATK